MKTYCVIEKPARFGPGTLLALDGGQARARAHVLDVVDREKGIYRSAGSVEFKIGEVIGLEGVPPKHLSECVVDPKEAETRAAKDGGKTRTARSRRDKTAAAGAAAS